MEFITDYRAERYALDTKWEDLPEKVQTWAKMCGIDLMSALVLGSYGKQFAAGTKLARTAGLTGQIPVVGGALGDTFRTVASGVAFLKSTVGVGAMIILFVLLLPVLIGLLLTRLSLRLSHTVADLLGCESESRLLSELVHIFGMLIAVVSLCSVLLIFALTLFVRTSAA